MKYIDKLLVSLDSFFENKKKSDVVLIFLLPVIVFGGLSYKFLFPICDKMLASNKQQAGELKEKIVSAKAFLGQGEDPKQFAVLLGNKIAILQTELSSVKTKNSKVESELSGMEFAYLDQDSVNSFLDAVTGYASKSSLKVQKISSEFVDINGSVLKKKALIELSASGDFKNIVYLVGDMENSKFLGKIDSVKLQKSKGVDADISVSLYGLAR